MNPAISLQQVSKAYTERANGPHNRGLALEHIHIDIMPGEFFVLLGPSGCGKSTLLRIMSGLDVSYEGSVAFGEEASLSRISFVFQQFALFPWLTVFENVELALIARNVSAEARVEKVKNELKLLGLEKSAHAYPRELSGGMRQRVGIARALVTDPRVIFMDEPFSELDSFTAVQLRKELLDIWQKRRPTVVMVTHIITEAIELADRIAVLTQRPGKIKKTFTNSLPRPRHQRSEPFWRLEDELYETLKQ
ncbi:ABC transporter ATP-binding protein [Candidatus Azambacteria bacterium]|nr:ABC transporter ATP-binding protein [Candidatus Azambacteria bacterium]MBI3684996.1 ABC transporter ATP-binding protein [Candidatus Azambacteria bacterium]